MDIGILGTGQVGRALGGGFVAAGHRVCLGARTATHEGADAWSKEAGESACHGTFADAARFGDLVFNCVGGQHAVAAVSAAGSEIGGKILVDVSNPLDFSQGFPPVLSHVNGPSLAEEVAAGVPEARVVKTLNTVANAIMVNPGQLDQPTDLFICGDDAEAKAEVQALLRAAFGWERFLDLGDLSNARGMEAWLLLWTRMFRALGTGDFNVRVVRANEG